MARLLNMSPDNEIEPNLSDHLTYLGKQNQRPRSIRERRLAVLRAARALGHPVAHVDRDGLRAWQDSRAYLTPAGMHNELVHVSQYLRWCIHAEIRHDDPTVVLVRPRNVHQSLPRPMADPLIQRAIDTADEPVRTWIKLGAFCGLRCMEIAQLAREDVMPGIRPHLLIAGKGGRERVVPAPASLIAALSRYPDAGPLFARMDGKPGAPSAVRVSERINKHLHANGITDTAHSLRHRFGTKLYEETEDPFLVAEIMGHRSTETTRWYVQILALKGAGAVESISELAA